MTLALLALTSTGCVMGYTVEVSNSLDTTVVIEMSQYHAKHFDGTRPAEFTPDLLGGTTSVTVEPGEKAEVVPPRRWWVLVGVASGRASS